MIYIKSLAMHNIMRTIAVPTLLGLSLVGSAAAQSNPKQVWVSFQNPAKSIPVRFRLISDSDGAKPVKLNDRDLPLAPGRQRAFESFPGMTWQIIESDSGDEIARYVTDTSPQQAVDIGQVILASAPVRLKFQNTTDAPIDVFYMDDTDSLASIVAGRYRHKNVTISLVRVPGGKIRWTSDGEEGTTLFNLQASNDSELQAHLIADAHAFDCVFEKGLVKGLSGHGITFDRIGDTSSGVLIAANVKPGSTIEADLGDESDGPKPGSRWRIQQNGKFYADFVARSTAIQNIDVLKQGTWFLPVTAIFKNTTSDRVKVHFIDVNGLGTPILQDDEGYENTLERGQWVSQPARPFHLFRVLSDRDAEKWIDLSLIHI